ncbi:NAD(P)-binding protein [Polyplosphaeria fusca]|uniref:NAD(P)-binding protein n=1 Tax=Polyplosphaeria fusca TaxID=682080 RepID=A0A9P4R0Z5_9PLEO|nr:NAD(P)-binding protein [Polyplosphaeria fusca]
MASPTPFAGQVILVTGAASGIGLATARYLAARGATLALADIKDTELTDAATGIQNDFPDAKLSFNTLDIASTESVDKFVTDIIQRFGKLNGAVNNAGVMGPLGPITELKDDDAQRVIDVNVGGTLRCLRAELRVIEEGGSIVNIASVAGLIAYPGLAAYVASKHAVAGLTKCAAKESGARNIRVNAVCPGAIDTPMLNEQRSEKASLPPPPIARLGRPEEIAAMIGYLLGSESGYTSGACLPVDGAGWVC